MPSHLPTKIYEIRVPDLDLGQQPLKLGSWLAGLGIQVVEGERVVEIVSQEVVVDLSAPADGTLIQQLVSEDEDLQVGQVVGVVEAG